ncbi:MAG: condensation domain-containing protein [Chloroflexota bacterium]
MPLTDVQRDVVLYQLGAEGSAAYDLSTTLRLRGTLDLDALRVALRRLVQRHEALRTTFEPTGEHQLVHLTARST